MILDAIEKIAIIAVLVIGIVFGVGLLAGFVLLMSGVYS